MKDDVQVIAPVGMPGAGKSFCTSHLVEQGFPSIYVGGFVVEEVKAHGLEVNEQNEKKVREDMRSKEGADVLAKRTVAKIMELVSLGHTRVVIDGLYSWSEYKIYKERFGEKLVVIAIAAPRKLRHQRLANRAVRPLSDEQVTAREYAEIENIEKGGPIANADYTLVNDGTSQKFLESLDQTMAKIGFIN